MPRIRTIKPEFPEDEGLGGVSRDARFLYVLLWTRCDDLGRFRAAPSLLRGQLYPYDDDVTARHVAGWLEELIAAGRVRLYEVADQKYAEVVNWSKHQRIDNASKTGLMPNPPWVESDGTPSADTLGDSPRLAAGEEGSGGDQEGSGGEVDPAAATQLADAALNALADRITRSAKRRDERRYRAGVYKSLRRERSVEAFELAVAHPGWDLTDMLDALEPGPAATVVYLPDPACPDCDGDGWIEAGRDVVECTCRQRRPA